MSFSVYLPIAASSVNLFLLLSLGGLVGFVSGLFGVGGGFLLTPLLIMIGIPPTVAAASDSNQIVAASASGMYAHYQLGNVDFKMGFLLLLGGLAGGGVGVHLVKILRASGNADFAIKIAYVAMLGTIGSYMFVESLHSLKGPRKPRETAAALPKSPSWYARNLVRLPLQMHFEKSGVHVSLLVPLFLGAVVGVLSAIMGVGGGFIMVPIMVYLLRMPMHVVIGTSLFQIFFTCVEVTVMQAQINHTVDFILALILLVGSTSGAQLGVRMGRRLKGERLRNLLAIMIIAVMLQILYGLLFTPGLLLSYKGGH